jgi:hypothetical protein
MQKCAQKRLDRADIVRDVRFADLPGVKYPPLPGPITVTSGFTRRYPLLEHKVYWRQNWKPSGGGPRRVYPQIGRRHLCLLHGHNTFTVCRVDGACSLERNRGLCTELALLGDVFRPDLAGFLQRGLAHRLSSTRRTLTDFTGPRFVMPIRWIALVLGRG